MLYLRRYDKRQTVTEISKLEDIAAQVRRDIIRMVTLAASGHPGGSLSSADFLTALFFKEMNHDPRSWTMEGRGKDVFILSVGHISPVYYSLLARTGYFPTGELAGFRKLGSFLQGHPAVEWNVQGVHISSGSLGQGLSVGCGMALAKRLNGDNKYVYVLIGDGESQEGQIWEAATFAAKYGLANLITMTDWNNQQIDGTVESVMNLGDLQARWEASGWDCEVVDGHNMGAIIDAYKWAKDRFGNGKPKMLLMKTIMGKGVDFMEDTHLWHGTPTNVEQERAALAQLRETLGDF